MTFCLYKFEYTVAHLCQSLLVVCQALGAFSARSYLVQFNKIFIQLENQGIEHHYLTILKCVEEIKVNLGRAVLFLGFNN